MTMTDDNTAQPAQEPQGEKIPKEQYYRLAADFDNYRKAMEKRLVEVSDFAAQAVVLKMADVMDHMDQAMMHATETVKAEAEWFKGLTRIDESFHETMKQFGVQRIRTVGKPFDPATMEAVQQVTGGESHTVQSEVRAGYTMHGRVIRPARVIIYH